MGVADLTDWTFDIRERSAGVYEGLAAHRSGASIAAVSEDPEDLLQRLKADAERMTIA